MTKLICSIEDCANFVHCRGWCGKHYYRWRKHGDPHRVERTYGDYDARFWEKVDKSGDCWEWTAYLSDGYGTFSYRGKVVGAHRWAYEQLVEPIPESLQIDHLCRNRACVNPDHMEPVTQRENILRGEGLAAKAARQTHCVHGHEWTPENTYLPMRSDGRPRQRVCRACKRSRPRPSRAKVRL